MKKTDQYRFLTFNVVKLRVGKERDAGRVQQLGPGPGIIIRMKARKVSLSRHRPPSPRHVYTSGSGAENSLR